jgi:glyoxylase-like metal-dependent hydrolase (beta-lactamase superfamily II)
MGSSIPTGSDVAPGVTRLAPDYSTFIDSGTDKDAKEARRFLASKGATVDDVAAVFVTHAHADHISGLKNFPRATIYIGAEDVPVLMAERPYDGFLPRLSGSLKKPAVDDSSKIQNISDGQQITIGNKTVTAYAAPGHTKGSVVYVLDDIIFAGDTMVFGSNKAHETPKPMSDDAVLARNSIRSIVERLDSAPVRPRLVFPSHSAEGTFDSLKELVR